ncbi:MAG: DTW domain-containing protein [Planctomycetota bacterium]|nr:DTW domain-containing protein [Planctomycetota bacterium]
MPPADLPADATDAVREPRAMCPRCGRPESVCYCAALTTIETRTRIVILQHPRERGMPIGTAHMAQLCLPNASLHVGTAWDGSEVLAAACGDPERPPILLYPGEDATDILAEPPPAPVTLVVVDGTWSQAKTLVRDNPGLAALPRYAFTAPAPSNYRIRREPSAAYVSTLEALMHVLGALEGDATRFQALMAPMNAMVDAQIEAKRSASPPRVHLRKRLTPYERLPREVLEQHEDLVLVFGDANAWPVDSPQRALGDELIHWVALRPSTGETFSEVLAPRQPLAPDIPGHVGLPADALQGGVAVETMLARFAAFTRPTDIVASWGHHGLRMFQDVGGQLPGAYLDLRETARALTEGKVGPLERFAPAGGLEAPPLDVPGRRLAGILAAWRRLPPPPPQPAAEVTS